MERPPRKNKTSITETSDWRDWRSLSLEPEASLRDARAGNYERLASRMRAGMLLADEERQLVAEILESGKFPRAAQRPKSVGKSGRDRAMATIVRELERGNSVRVRETSDGYEVTPLPGDGPVRNKDAVGMVAKMFNLAESTVRSAMTAQGPNKPKGKGRL